VGSGLILLVIVAAWLAVLVPMALRSHDSGAAMSSVDKFSDAMRVLARREAAARSRAAAVVLPPRPEGSPEGGRGATLRRLAAQARQAAQQALAVGHLALRAGLRVLRSGYLALRSGLLALRSPAADRGSARRPGPLTPAERRRRVLLTLVGAAAVTGVAALVGPSVLLYLHLLVDALLVGFVVSLRRRAVLAAPDRRKTVELPEHSRGGPERTRRPGQPASYRTDDDADVPDVGRSTDVEAVAGAAQVADVGARTPAPSTAARHDDPLPAARTADARGGAWQPVPVPVPIYVTAPAAPRRIVDLTRTGARSEGELAEGAEPAEHKRAVNDW